MKNMGFDFDVAVVGGGPAGMIAAGIAAEKGARVILIDKNKNLGRKLLLTGSGRCNLANAEFNTRVLAEKYGREGKFLLSPFSEFGPKETIDFFEERGMKTKTERGKRVFPTSDQAQSVLDILLKFLREGGVSVISGSGVKEISLIKGKFLIDNLLLKNKKIIKAKNYIICTGGKSYPDTGSTGDGFTWMEKLGHKIIKPKPALVPIKIKEKWPTEAQGLSLKNVKLTVYQNGRKRESQTGEALFTHFGISGPIVIDMSKKVGEYLEKGEACHESYRGVKLFLDLKPALDLESLDRRLQRDFKKYQNKLFRNSLEDLLPQKLIPVFIKLTGIDPEKKVNLITREERRTIVKLLKGMEMTVDSLLGFEFAIVTNGGVALKEIDAKTMKSKLINNLYFAGEIINLDGPCGGYNLQLCWSTGHVAGKSAAEE